MKTYTERPGSPGIYTSQGDYIGSIEDDTIRAEAIAGLNGEGAVNDSERELLDACIEQGITDETDISDLQELKIELKDLKVENAIILENLKSLHDNDVFNIDDFLDKYEGIEDTLPQEFFSSLRKLTQKVYNLQVENFGEERPKAQILPLKKKSRSKTKA